MRDVEVTGEEGTEHTLIECLLSCGLGRVNLPLSIGTKAAPPSTPAKSLSFGAQGPFVGLFAQGSRTHGVSTVFTCTALS
jgi:hypothetical protein